MRIEVIIYVYGVICLCMIAFNLIYNIVLQRSEPHLERQSRKIRKEMDAQLKRIRKGQAVEEKHLEYLRHTLSRVNNLIAFDRVLKAMLKEKHGEVRIKYLTQIQPVIVYLARLYQKRENMQAAYYSYFLSQYTVEKQVDSDSVQDVLLEYMKKDSLYCRVNALQALYTFGNAEHILTALKAQDDGKVFLHEKILTEGLLSFTGDHHELIGRLWEVLDSFSEHTQLGILNYIRLKSGDYTKQMFALMEDETKGKELRLSAIRYFGKYYYEPALEPLVRFASEKDPLRWEYTTVSISSLARYPGEKVIATLKEAIHSPNWYVRYSAATSLEAHHMDYTALIDIVAGDDRYAREMMLYRLETQKLQKQKVGV